MNQGLGRSACTQRRATMFRNQRPLHGIGGTYIIHPGFGSASQCFCSRLRLMSSPKICPCDRVLICPLRRWKNSSIPANQAATCRVSTRAARMRTSPERRRLGVMGASGRGKRVPHGAERSGEAAISRRRNFRPIKRDPASSRRPASASVSRASRRPRVRRCARAGNGAGTPPRQSRWACRRRR